MRKLVLAIVLSIITGLIFTGSIFAEEAILKIGSLEGQVLIKKAGQEEWVKAKLGDLLYKDDMVKSLEDGIAYLEFSPDNGFTLSPNSSVVVADSLKKQPPLVAEPYSEAAGEAFGDVFAPEVNQEGAASRI